MKYELSMFLSPKMTDEEAEERIKNLDKILEKFEAKVLESNFLGMKDLAYEIKHFKQGYYFIAKIEAEPSEIKKIKNRVYDELEAIRLLVTKQEKDVKLIVEEKKVEPKDEEKTGLEKKEKKAVLKPEVKKKELKETDLDKKLDKILEEEIVD